MYTDYMLSKWSIYVRVRDKYICRMCLNTDIPRRLLHAHHIDRKVDHPEIALHLNNGICLCSDCHLAVVHSTHKNHKQFRVIFKRWVRRVAQEEFEQSYQDRLKYS